MNASIRMIDVDGLKLRVSCRGSGPPVLLINGIGAHLGMWSVLEAALPNSTLIAYDSPGTGGSERSLLPLSMTRLGRLAVRILDSLETDRVDLLGYSFGGVVAQWSVLHAPERFRRLVLVATTPGLGGGAGSPLSLLNLATPFRYYSRRYHERTVGVVAGGRARSDRDWIRDDALRRRESDPDAVGYMWQLAAAMRSIGTLSRLRHIQQPTLVVSGDDDPIMPATNGFVLAEMIPDARLVLARGEGHLMLLDPESETLPKINDFLSAPDLTASQAWSEAADVDEQMVERSVPGGLRGLLDPWRPVNGLARRLCRSWAKPSTGC